jgi:hypothetical protein
VSEARDIVAGRIRELEELSRDELLATAEAAVESRIEGPSGRIYRLRVSPWEDPDDDDSGAQVKLYGTGLRSLARLRANAYVPDADMPEAQRSALAEPGRITNRTQDVLSAATMIAVITALIAPWFIGVGFLISLVL